MNKIVHITAVDLSLRYLLLNQLVYIKEQGFSVSTISSPGINVAEVKNAGIQHISIPISRSFFSPIRDLISLVRLYKIIRVNQFQIVHTHTPKASFLGQIAARLAGTPIIIRTLHGFYFHDGMSGALREFIIRMEKIVGRRADIILSQNREDIQTAIKEGICTRDKIEYLGNGIDIDDFNPDKINEIDKARKRQELGISDSKKIVGFVGRLVVEKGVLDLLKAVKIVKQEMDDVQFLFVGPVDYDKKDAVTPEMAEIFEVAEHCRFVGFQNEMPLVYSLMDVFVLPSHREGFPRSLMEASAMGIPSIATDIRGCREVIKDQENGLLVPLKDPNGIAKGLLTLLTNSEFTAEMGQNGRAAAKLYFDEQIVFKKVLQTYRDLLNQKLPFRD